MKHHPLIVAGKELLTDQKLVVRNPYDGSVFAEVSVAGENELESALQAAVAGFEDMKQLSTLDRIRILDKARELLKERAEDFAVTIATESGKTIREARGEVARAQETLRLSAIAAEEHMGGPVLPLDAAPNAQSKWGFAQRFGAGPVLAITPFNFPLNLAMHKVGPAIAAGNSFILKPASTTAVTGLMLGRLMLDAGVPPHAVSVIAGPGSKVAEPLAADDRIKVVTFTGSPPVGTRLAKIAGMKLFAFELGSNSGVYVHSDADLMFAADRIVTGAFALAGQVCISTQRVYAHEAIFDQLLNLLLTGARALKIGNQLDETTDMGPMISKADAERTAEWIAKAVSGSVIPAKAGIQAGSVIPAKAGIQTGSVIPAKAGIQGKGGGKILCGGNYNGALFEPTILTDVPPDSDIVRREAFAPVLIVEKVSSAEEGIRMVGDSDYGLHAGIFTRDIHIARKAFECIDVGGVIVNDVPTWRADLIPYGGNNLSGLGREGPRYAIEHMTVWKTFVVQKET